MVGSIDPRCETIRGAHWPKKVAWLFGARVAETILASGPLRPNQQAGHMDASDPIRPSKKLLWHGGRPHMGPGARPGRRCRLFFFVGAIAASFDHLVGAGEQRGRHGPPERLGRLEVVGRIDLRRWLDRQG